MQCVCAAVLASDIAAPRKQPVSALTHLDTLCDGCDATQVPGCALPEDVSTLKKVHQRARACPLHLQSLSLLEDGRALRFCQRCCKWEAVDAFEVRTRVAVVLNVRCVRCPKLEGTHLDKRPTHTRPLCLLQDGATAADCGMHTRAAMCCVLTARFPGGCRTTSGPASSRSPCTTSEGGPITRRPRTEDLLLVDECTQSLLALCSGDVSTARVGNPSPQRATQRASRRHVGHSDAAHHERVCRCAWSAAVAVGGACNDHPRAALTCPSLTAHRAEWQRAPPERWSLAQCDEPLKEWVLQLDGAWRREKGQRELTLTSFGLPPPPRKGTELYSGETFFLKASARHAQ